MRPDATVLLPGETELPHRPRHLTAGAGPDLLVGARDATRAMIERLGVRYGVAPEVAYALCSVATHLRIIEVVDAPNWVVRLELDTSVLT